MSLVFLGNIDNEDKIKKTCTCEFKKIKGFGKKQLRYSFCDNCSEKLYCSTSSSTSSSDSSSDK